MMGHCILYIEQKILINLEPHICRKQLRYTAQADIDLNRPKLITKVAKGNDQPRTVHGQGRHKPTREVTESDHSKRLSEIRAP